MKLKQLFAALPSAALLVTSIALSTAHAETPVPRFPSAMPNTESARQWTAHIQSTYIAARKNNFNSPYSGGKSLLNNVEGDIPLSYTLTATAFLGARLWKGGEIYYNPEIFQGIPFSDLAGLGAFTNGELQKGTAIPAIYYPARLFIRQTFGLGEAQESFEDGANQIAGNYDKRRIVISFGAFSALDHFDINAYSHDPRTQFMNWALVSAGAYDYAANSRGLTFGLAGEYATDDWVIRAARLALPVSPNILELDYTLKKDYGDQVEIDHRYKLWGHPGILRVLAFRNHALMARYTDAINQSIQTSIPPNILTSRYGFQWKQGYLLNLEQAITGEAGLFVRWSWNDGQSEAISYDIGNSLSGELLLKGNGWGRSKDSLGTGMAINGLSDLEIRYLQLGGATMMIGDGQLRYGEERILEFFYSAHMHAGIQLSADYQRYTNPGYNTDRGPVNIYGLRLHLEI